MIAVCAMIDGAKGPTFGVASLRSVSAAVSPDERSEESPKAMSIRGASSNSASSVKRKELTWDDEKLLGLMLAA